MNVILPLTKEFQDPRMCTRIKKTLVKCTSTQVHEIDAKAKMLL